MKSGFVSTVSHELRTPLTSIYGFAETLLRAGRPVRRGGAEHVPPLHLVRVRAADVDRRPPALGRGGSTAATIPVQLGEADVGCGRERRRALRRRAATGRRGRASSSRSPDEKLAAQADGDKLGQVLSHLLDNAVRYSPARRDRDRRGAPADGAVEVSVEDEGAGIPHAEQERIFRKLYRGDAVGRSGWRGRDGPRAVPRQGVRRRDGRARSGSTRRRVTARTFVLELRAAGE